MTESNDSPSLFPEGEISPAKKVTRARRKTATVSEGEATPAETKPKATRTTRSTKAKAAEGEPAEAKPATRTRRTTKAAETAAPAETEEKPKARRVTKAAATDASEETAVAKETKPLRKRAATKREDAPVASEEEAAPRRRTVRKKAETADTPEAAPVEQAEAATPAAARKTRTRTTRSATPAIPVRPPGTLPEPEEWAPGSRSGAETKAPVEPVAPPQPAAPAPASQEPPAPRRSSAPESREGRTEEREAAPRGPQPSHEVREQQHEPREQREGQREPRVQREGQREREGHREGRDRRGGFNRRDRNFRRDRRDRQDRYDRPDNREQNREQRESRESREQRIAAARQEFSAPEPASDEPPVFAEGIVEVSGKGFGFLRDPKRNFAQHPNDIFVTPEVCRRYPLRDGMWIKGEIRRGNRGMQLYKLTEIEGEAPDKILANPLALPMFEELTTVNPNRVIRLETTPDRYTTRVIDLMAPIGRGQRGLIVAPPRTGKTTLLQHVAEAVVQNHPDMKLIILLVDERPEEVTEIRRSVPGAEVMASSNDMDLKSHTRIAQFAIERAKRLVEMGKHVFVLLDSITRVGRAFNNATSGGGRTMSGGVDARALEIPRKLFAAARNTEEAGSLTIVATALIETGSRMDDLIFQEFKGTGNMELVLDRRISDLRVYPAVDIFQSGTRREELLLPESDLHKINIIRRGLAGHKPAEAIERLLSFLRKFPTNAQMLREIPG